MGLVTRDHVEGHQPKSTQLNEIDLLYLFTVLVDSTLTGLGGGEASWTEMILDVGL